MSKGITREDMKWIKKSEEHSRSYRLYGRKNNNIMIIEYNSYYNYFNFIILKKNKIYYDSLWDNNHYNSEDKCKEACEKYCSI